MLRKGESFHAWEGKQRTLYWAEGYQAPELIGLKNTPIHTAWRLPTRENAHEPLKDGK